AVGVNLEIEETPADKVAAAMLKHEFEAALVDGASGFGMFRVYRFWTQTVALDLTNPALSEALNTIRHAANDDQYRSGVVALQQTMSDDPPAIFLAWSSRSRAVTKRFDVQAQPGRDIMTTLRMWRPSADNRRATNN